MRFLTLAAALCAFGGYPIAPWHDLAAQTAPRRVSLEEAIRIADRSSEAVEIARASTTRAAGQLLVARSALRPQLNVSGSYARTLASQFEGFSFGGPDTNTFRSLCTPNIPPNATPAERDAAIDQARTCQATGGLPDFSSVGFGAENQWVLGIQFSQNLFTGGRALGQQRAAAAGRRAADIELAAQRAQLVLDVTQAYYNAALAERLAQIAAASLAMSDDVLRQTTRARQVGSSSEFDLLRAQVARDNQVPQVLQRRSDRTVAMLRLKQLLEIPLDDSLELTTSIDDAPLPAIANASAREGYVPDTSAESRSTVRQAAENVRAQEALLRAARGERLPSLALTSGYQRLFFPTSTFPELNDYRENWTVGVSAAVSLLSGGRTRGGELLAEANLREARARLKQTRELAALESRVVLSQLEQAEALWRASTGTAEQARRAYSIDLIRHREGISTQTELAQSQLLVEQSLVNRAVAARDLAVARVRRALLRDLPVGAAGLMGGVPAGSPSAGAALPPTPPPSRPSTGASPTTGNSQQ